MESCLERDKEKLIKNNEEASEESLWENAEAGNPAGDKKADSKSASHRTH
jgi:hypothetical protein